MKSSSREFYPPIPEQFIQALLATSACIGGVIANASDPANVAKSQEWHANEASARDQARRLGTPKLGGAPPRRIGERHLNYIRLVIQTLVQVVEAIGIQYGVPKRLTVIADRENIGKHSQDLSTAFESAMQAVGATGSLRWEALHDDHLLYLPDLVAGIITRHFNHDDALEATSLLWREAQRSQRVKFANKVPQAPA